MSQNFNEKHLFEVLKNVRFIDEDKPGFIGVFSRSSKKRRHASKFSKITFLEAFRYLMNGYNASSFVKNAFLEAFYTLMDCYYASRFSKTAFLEVFYSLMDSYYAASSSKIVF